MVFLSLVEYDASSWCIASSISHTYEAMCVNLQPVIQSEVSQKNSLRTDVGPRKTVLMKPCGRAGIETQLERSNLWTQWGRDRVGRTTSSADVCTLPHAEQVPRGELLSSTGTQRRALG